MTWSSLHRPPAALDAILEPPRDEGGSRKYRHPQSVFKVARADADCGFDGIDTFVVLTAERQGYAVERKCACIVRVQRRGLPQDIDPFVKLVGSEQSQAQ